MIKLLTDDKITDFSVFCEKKLTGAVIYTRFLTYGLYSGDAFFWYSENEEGAVNGVFSMLDGILLACTDQKNHDEISLFSQTVGASHITYGEAEFTMKYVSNSKDFSTCEINGENIKDAFDVIFEDNSDKALFFEKWYTDASHKIRHSLIHGKCIYRDGKCVSVALTSGETDSIAVISSVATLKKYRNQGFGEQVVISLAKSLGKDVFLMTDSKKTAEWYERMGFIKQ